jgi:hypothetical protein
MHADRQSPRPRRKSPDTMSSNRPFFSNFLAAFRAQSAIQKAAAPGSYAHTTSPSPQNANQAAASTSRAISTKAGPPSPGATTAAVQATGQFQPTRQHAAPYHRSTSPATTKAFPIPGASARSRRGSDSSSEGFHEVMGAEKWYIGGRTATGEEKFYKLGMVKRNRSVDRLSLDRLSI